MDSLTDPAPRAGWAMPSAQDRAHYFIDGVAICHRYKARWTGDTHAVALPGVSCGHCFNALARRTESPHATA